MKFLQQQILVFKVYFENRLTLLTQNKKKLAFLEEILTKFLTIIRENLALPKYAP